MSDTNKDENMPSLEHMAKVVLEAAKDNNDEFVANAARTVRRRLMNGWRLSGIPADYIAIVKEFYSE